MQTMMTIVWCMVTEIWARQTEFFVILDSFLPFYPPLDPENQNFQKTKKNTWGYYHFTYDVYMVPECDGQNFLSFWKDFCPFTSLKTWQIKILKKWKKKKTPRDTIILCKCTINDNHMMYGSRDLRAWSDI